ncbi:amidase family protein [Streptomyces sp. NBC_01808]|uniref:amidase family protein n=1 Tax=Streptomyces sp. NBC_01808 TaxID=2975947 RepID=UPI002DDC51E5|nr:amidase family protein [Streptomyces sp. NBC_01808]WSA40666.1 amidase family protein [Streptomyces sp. NBC_01808]
MRTPAPRPSRRSLLALGSAAAAAPVLGATPAHAGTGRGRVPDAPDGFDELDIAELRRRMADGRLDAAGQLDDLPGQVVVQIYEFKREINAYLSGAAGDVPRSLAELIEFNRENADRELRYVRQDGLETVHRLEFGEAEYREALGVNHRLSRAEGIDAVLRRYRLDALVMPTSGPPAKIDLIRGDAYGGGSSTPAALAGYPAVSVPAGFAFGLPVGLTFMGTAWSEPTLLRPAYAYERATAVRRPPEYRAPDVGL